MTFKPPIAPNVAVDRAHVYDESTALPVRDGLKFVGAGVTATDDSNNDATIVTIPGGTSTTSGLGTDVWASQATPASVTDWGTVINALVAGGTKLLLFGQHDFPITTTINISSTSGVCFRGTAGDHWFPSTSGYSRLIWKGTGAGTAINLASSMATTFEDIAVSYDGAFTGTLINATSHGKFNAVRCHFGYAVQGQTITAALGIDLTTGIQATFDRCTFEGFLTSLRGFATAGPAFWSNGAMFRDCVFQGQVQHSVLNPGDGWVFEHCIFESVGAADQTVLSHIQMDSGSNYGVALTLRDCAHWDASSASTKWIAQSASISANILLVNCVEHNASLTRSLSLLGNGMVTVIGGEHMGPDFGDPSIAGQKKMSVTVIGVQFDGPPVNVRGHTSVNIGGGFVFNNTGGVNTVLNAEVGRLALEGADTALPSEQVSGATHAGATNVVFLQSNGTNVAGWLEVNNGTGGASSTGQIADLTFGITPVLNGAFGPQPYVQLTPGNTGAAAAAGYVVVDSANPVKFTVAINNAIPASTVARWYYRVTWSAT